MSEEQQENLFCIVGIFVSVVIYVVWLLSPGTPTMYKSNSSQECVYVVTGDGEKTTCDYIKKGDLYDLVWVE